MKDLCRSHHHKIIVLIEPRINKPETDAICRRNQDGIDRRQKDLAGCMDPLGCRGNSGRLLHGYRSFLHVEVGADGEKYGN